MSFCCHLTSINADLQISTFYKPSDICLEVRLFRTFQAMVAAVQEVSNGCWVKGVAYSHYFICCAKQEHWRNALQLPDCWEHGWAHGSRETCCSADRAAKLDNKTAQLAYGISSAASPCSAASPAISSYLADAADRLLYRGLPFAAEDAEDFEAQLVEDADSTYEACPAALLLVLASQVGAVQSWS